MVLVRLLICAIAVINSQETEKPKLYPPGTPPSNVSKPIPDPDFQAAVQSGEAQLIKRELAKALESFGQAMQINPRSSLVHYRIAEIYFARQEFESALKHYRMALNGDGDSGWVEALSHVKAGQLLDITGNRDEALNEYKQAIQTGDNTHGAVDKARKFLESPFRNPSSTANASSGASVSVVSAATDNVNSFWMNRDNFERATGGIWYTKVPDGRWLQVQFVPNGVGATYHSEITFFTAIGSLWRIVSSIQLSDPGKFWFEIPGIESYKQMPECHISSLEPTIVFDCKDQGRTKSYAFVRTVPRIHAKAAVTASRLLRKHLMTAAAQAAVDKALDEFVERWSVDPYAVVTVQGVTENEQTNTAIADLAFTHLFFQCMSGGSRSEQRWKSGKATFKHYTDGPWVLTNITADGINWICPVEWQGSIPVR